MAASPWEDYVRVITAAMCLTTVSWESFAHCRFAKFQILTVWECSLSLSLFWSFAMYSSSMRLVDNSELKSRTMQVAFPPTYVSAFRCEVSVIPRYARWRTKLISSRSRSRSESYENLRRKYLSFWRVQCYRSISSWIFVDLSERVRPIRSSVIIISSITVTYWSFNLISTSHVHVYIRTYRGG